MYGSKNIIELLDEAESLKVLIRNYEFQAFQADCVDNRTANEAAELLDWAMEMREDLERLEAEIASRQA